MKIGYFGDGPWSHRALDELLATRQAEIQFIVARFKNPDPVLRERAAKLGVPFFTHHNVNSPEFLAQIGPFGCDLLISMSFDQILRKSILEAAPLGFINCHAGALPFYRGRNILNWALINGATEIGVTVHHVDEGIDTGDIILQRKIELGQDTDYAQVLEAAIDVCATTLRDAAVALADGTAKRTRQVTIHPRGFYCGMRRAGDEWLQWEWTSKRVHDFVRAITVPGPGARTVLSGQEWAVLRTSLIAQAPEYICTPGEVVGRDPEGVVVKTGDATIHVSKVAAVTANGTLDTAIVPAWRIGTRLGMNLYQRVLELQREVAELKAKAETTEAVKHKAEVAR
jgi:methionyl-tRNA formyltransferase